ncbi:MAG: hypothetical protein IK076_09500, partial [Bacteroidales bacterium]|nr:hypothetical protein [Bacteroidales bacterium]
MKIRFSFRLATIMVGGVLLSLTAMGQDFQGGYFLGGYNAAFRMNPAIQNERSIFALGLGNIGVGANSNQVGPDTFLYDVNGELLSAFDRKISADTFLGKLSRDKNKAGVNMNLDVLTLGFWSGRNYWTVDVRARAGLQACVPYDFFSLLKA